MEFTPVVYEHAAKFIGRSPWEVSRSADLLVEAHAAAYAVYRHTPVVAGIDVYNVEAEAYGAVVGASRGNEVPSDVPWSPLQTLPEVVADPQARANEFFTAFAHPVHGTVEVVTNPVKLNRNPHMVRMPAPEFSQHTEEVFLEMGYSWEEIERFKNLGIIA